MTTLIGIQGEGFSVMCVDSRISDVNDFGWATQIATLRESSSKVATNGRYMLGAAGDLRAINILHHVFNPPVAPPNLKGKKLDQFITAKFIPALRECFDAQGYSTPQTEESEHLAEHGSSIMMSINGSIYIIDGDYSWISDANGVYAVGTGAQYALGALHCLIPKTKLTMNAAKRIALNALAVAAKYDPYTGAPYHSFTQGNEKITKQNGK
jgi:ATP-dependent protease HslVU (ClpYQ) peptidase subunit